MSHPPAERRRRRWPRRWPLVLLSVLLVLLALGTVIAAQRYWSGLRSSIGQMRASVAAAQQEQQRLMARVRVAEAALAERAEALAGAEAAGTAAEPEPEPSVRDHQPVGSSPPREVALRTGLAPAGRAWMAARLEALAREALRLRPEPAPTRRPTAAGAQLLHDQLAVAAAAAVADDTALLDAALFGAQRLTGPPHRSPDPRSGVIAAELAGLRERLRLPGPRMPVQPAVPPAVYGPAVQQPQPPPWATPAR